MNEWSVNEIYYVVIFELTCWLILKFSYSKTDVVLLSYVWANGLISLWDWKFAGWNIGCYSVLHILTVNSSTIIAHYVNMLGLYSWCNWWTIFTKENEFIYCIIAE